MLIILLILLVGLTPSLCSLWLLRRADSRAQSRLSYITETVATRRLLNRDNPPELHYIQGFGYVIGNISCRYNARSPYIRCAVNPAGPCSECSQYEPTRDDSAHESA